MRIIHENTSNGVTVIIPSDRFLSTLPEEWTEEQKMIYVADKDLPTGTKYEIVADSDVPTDRTERVGWQYVAGPNEKTSQDII